MLFEDGKPWRYRLLEGRVTEKAAIEASVGTMMSGFIPHQTNYTHLPTSPHFFPTNHLILKFPRGITMMSAVQRSCYGYM